MEDCPECVVRPLRMEDAATVAVLIRLAFAAQTVVTDPPASARKETAASVAAGLAALDQGGFGAWSSHDLIGCVLWQVIPTAPTSDSRLFPTVAFSDSLVSGCDSRR